MGYRADLNVIDHDALTLHAPEIAHDLPADGRRLMQRASPTSRRSAGAITYRDGERTGALPGGSCAARARHPRRRDGLRNFCYRGVDSVAVAGPLLGGERRWC
ncbi:hypothetical protein AB5I41_19210 [Sphingomonas sp. MMS24-JH45]